MATRDPVALEAGRLLANLYEDRRRADYELANIHCENAIVAQVSVEQAARLKHLILQLDTEPLRSQIKIAMDQFQQQARPRNS